MSNPLLSFTDLPPFSQISQSMLNPQSNRQSQIAGQKSSKYWQATATLLGKILLPQLKKLMIA